jgi:PAS domain-containing protein
MADWHAIVVEGPGPTVRGFTAGFLAGRGEAREALFHGSDVGLEPGSFGERLHALLHGGRHEVLLVDARLGAALTSALAGHTDDLGIRVADRAVIQSASFAFRAETPSREAASRIKAALHHLPAGVALADDEREEIDPDAAAVELYAPAPAYTFRASGRITGPFDGVLAMRRRLRELDFVSLERLQLAEAVPWLR